MTDNGKIRSLSNEDYACFGGCIMMIGATMLAIGLGVIAGWAYALIGEAIIIIWFGVLSVWSNSITRRYRSDARANRETDN